MEQEFRYKLATHLNEWVKNNQSISWSLSGGSFISIDADNDILVDFTLFSEGYQQKHILSTPGNYSNNFLFVIQPQLTLFLARQGLADFKFTFKFLFNGVTTKDFYVKGLNKVEA